MIGAAGCLVPRLSAHLTDDVSHNDDRRDDVDPTSTELRQTDIK